MKSIESNENSALTRAEFLQTASKAALFAALGISVYGCSSESGPTSIDEPDPTPDPDPDNDNDNSDAPAITVDGNTITLNLEHPDLEELTQSEGWINITQSGAATIVINAAGTYRAFDNRCPHSGCDRNWEFDDQQLICTCHTSIFNNRGERLSGPASRDMTDYEVNRDGETLTITKS